MHPLMPDDKQLNSLIYDLPRQGAYALALASNLSVVHDWWGVCR